MKIYVTASSNLFCDKGKIIEANSIDEAINRLKTDKALIKSIVNIEETFLKGGRMPGQFVITTASYQEDCDLEIEIYDYYRE